MMLSRFMCLSALLFVCKLLSAQSNPVNPAILENQWSASWIACPDGPEKDYGVYHFRKTFELREAEEEFIVHVSADNRYRLFVNGQAVCNGPARGDLYNWYYETVDLAPYLKLGENVVAALVWNMGGHAPVAQVSNQTAFLLQGDTEKEHILNTNASWKTFHNQAYKPCSMDNGQRLKAYMVIGPGDDVDAHVYPWGWELQNYADDKWLVAKTVAVPASFGFGTDNLWTLVPRNIPLMEERKQALGTVRKVTGLEDQKIPLANTLLEGSATWTIPANKQVKILVDQGFNTVAYPELEVSQGEGAAITLSYAETLFESDGSKGNRNEVEGKKLVGNYDIFRPDGGSKRLFRPLWLRTFRYVELDIHTGEKPLVIENFYGMYSGYPFEEKAHFSSNDPTLKNIWEVGWRTARLCAGETYYDCPYYEQLQYEADTRIQALISLYVSGDDRLMRKALLDFNHSRVPEGLTQGRYPSNRLQVIPPFSLWWVSMIHDYWMHRKDDAFLQQFLVGMKGVLDWYERHIDPEKAMLGPMKWWNFVDYTHVFPNGVPDGATDGHSSVITLQYVYTLQQAAELFAYFNDEQAAAHYRTLAKQVGSATYNLCYNQEKGVISNTPEQAAFSQHASIMGVLTNTVPTEDQQAVMERVIADTSLGPATFYYRFYLNQALRHAGMGDRYYSQLGPWRDMLEAGLTTFAEKPDPARSDCHAWSASPNYDFLATICGVRPGTEGFSSVEISPALGELKEVSGSIPHPDGVIEVSLKRKGKDAITGTVTLPANISGTFFWAGQRLALKGGTQQIQL